MLHRFHRNLNELTVRLYQNGDAATLRTALVLRCNRVLDQFLACRQDPGKILSFYLAACHG